MKKLVSLLLLLPSLCVAAEEREIWACQGQKSEGYEGQENDTWKSVYFEPLNYLVTIDEGNSNVKVESEVLSVACSIAFFNSRTLPDQGYLVKSFSTSDSKLVIFLSNL